MCDKRELEYQLAESMRLFEDITGKTICHLRWSTATREVTVVVGVPGARVGEVGDFDLAENLERNYCSGGRGDAE